MVSRRKMLGLSSATVASVAFGTSRTDILDFSSGFRSPKPKRQLVFYTDRPVIDGEPKPSNELDCYSTVVHEPSELSRMNNWVYENKLDDDWRSFDPDSHAVSLVSVSLPTELSVRSVTPRLSDELSSHRVVISDESPSEGMVYTTMFRWELNGVEKPDRSRASLVRTWTRETTEA